MREKFLSIDNMSKEDILACVYKVVRNRGDVSGYLEVLCPHYSYLDLEVFYMLFGDYTTGMVTNKLCDRFDISDFELSQAADRNAKDEWYKVDTMWDIIAEMLMSGEPIDRSTMLYVGTNVLRNNGSSIILYPEYFKEVAEKEKSDLYILPSSIHEMIIIKDKYNMDAGMLKMMVSEINMNVVDDDEVLCDSVYKYSRETGRIYLVE